MRGGDHDCDGCTRLGQRNGHHERSELEAAGEEEEEEEEVVEEEERKGGEEEEEEEEEVASAWDASGSHQGRSPAFCEPGEGASWKVACEENPLHRRASVATSDEKRAGALTGQSTCGTSAGRAEDKVAEAKIS